jgi:hypothetical protein
MLFVRMTIAEWLTRGKEALRGVSPEKRLVGAVLAASVAAFNVGVVSSKDWTFSAEEAHAATSAPATVSAPVHTTPAAPATTTQTPSTGAGQGTEGGYVASKSGSKYYLPSCSGAKRIKPENQVWFATKEAAVAAGYEPAATCKGL